jgi:hypothetical protein
MSPRDRLIARAGASACDAGFARVNVEYKSRLCQTCFGHNQVFMRVLAGVYISMMQPARLLLRKSGECVGEKIGKCVGEGNSPVP